METVLNFTEKASRRVVVLAQKKGYARAVLRVGVRGGGCSGFSLFFEVVPEPDAGDLVVSMGDAELCCDPKSIRVLSGSTIDYEETLLKKNFVVNNPRKTKNCSCGESFSIV